MNSLIYSNVQHTIGSDQLYRDKESTAMMVRATALATALVLTGVASSAAYSPARALPPLGSSQSPASARCTTLAPRMLDEDAEKAAVATDSGQQPRASPLAGVVGDEKLREFQEYKDAENAKRLEMRKRNNILIPGVTLSLLLALQLAGGKAKLTELTGDMDGFDPLSNAPGVESGRKDKEVRQARAQAVKQDFVESIFGGSD